MDRAYGPAPDRTRDLALALLVTRVLADHHDTTVAADDLAFVADLLNAGLDLHDVSFCVFAVLVPVGCRGPLLFSDLLVAVDDTATGQIVGGQLHDHAVSREDTDVVLTHFARNMGENLVSVGQLNAKHRVGKSLDYLALDLDDAVFLGHSLTIASVGEC